jgi:uncharacterized protein YbaR (Trm112 family)
MAIPSWAVDCLQCPITGGKLAVATDDVLHRLRTQLNAGKIFNRLGQQIHEAPAMGFVNDDQTWFYIVEDSIPVLLADQAIPLKENLGS